MQKEDLLQLGDSMIQDALITKSLAIGQVVMSLGFLMVGIAIKPGFRFDIWPKFAAIIGFCFIVISSILVRKNIRFSFVALTVIGFSFVYLSNWIYSHVLPSVDKIWRHAIVSIYVAGMAVMAISVIKAVIKLYSIARGMKGPLG